MSLNPSPLICSMLFATSLSVLYSGMCGTLTVTFWMMPFPFKRFSEANELSGIPVYLLLML